MRKYMWTLGLFAFAFMGAFCARDIKKTPKEDILKVLSWNVWHEGHSKKYGKQACDGIIGVLKKSEADIILMVETYGASDQGSRFSGILLPPAFRQPVHLQPLSHYQDLYFSGQDFNL